MSYSRNDLARIWSKAQPAFGYDRNRFARDTYGTLITWDEYGLQSLHGWNVDHKIPLARGGGNHLGNLQPLHWQNNAKKGKRLF